MQGIAFIGVCAVFALILISIIGMTLSRLWRRATPEMAIIRTGGRKAFVTMEGGCFQIPIIHEIMRVNMQTMRLDITRDGENSLITKDRLRVDLGASFFTRVKRSTEGITAAASSLGARTMDVVEVRKLVESKFDDTLRAVAMSMTLGDLLDKRDDFRTKVLEAVGEDLQKNGLELEAVSITTINQTDKEWFKADNVIDAEGLTLITRQTETRRKERNDITQETEVAIRQRNQEATLRSLDINETERKATLDQEQRVASMEAEQAASVASTQASRRQETEQATIAADRAIRESQIEREQAIELAEQRRRIAVAKASRDQSEAEAEASLKQADAKTAEESIVTAGAVAQAERTKRIAVIASEQSAEQDAVNITVAAKAERAAAEDRAAAVLTEARAESESSEIRAKGVLASATAEAEGKSKIIAAENSISPEQVSLKRLVAIIEALPAILREQMKPLEKMTDFKVVHFDGMRPGIGGGGEGAVTSGNFTQQVLDAVQQYQLQSPIVNSALSEAGLLGVDGRLDVSALTKSVGTAPPPAKTKAKVPQPIRFE